MTILEFLYHTVPGRLCLKGLTAPALSRVSGHFLDSPASGSLISPFAKKNQINLDDYLLDDVHSFNDFFSRKIRPELRPVDMDPSHLAAPVTACCLYGRFREIRFFLLSRVIIPSLPCCGIRVWLHGMREVIALSFASV